MGSTAVRLSNFVRDSTAIACMISTTVVMHIWAHYLCNSVQVKPHAPLAVGTINSIFLQEEASGML